MGSGINLQYYKPERVEIVWGLEPSHGMRRRAQKNLAQSPVAVTWLDLPGEEIPLEDNSVDTIVLTYTLCSIPDWQRALQQMRRVLTPGGQLLFSEHGTAPDPAVKIMARPAKPYLENLWRRLQSQPPYRSTSRKERFQDQINRHRIYD